VTAPVLADTKASTRSLYRHRGSKIPAHHDFVYGQALTRGFEVVTTQLGAELVHGGDGEKRLGHVVNSLTGLWRWLWQRRKRLRRRASGPVSDFWNLSSDSPSLSGLT